MKHLTHTFEIVKRGYDIFLILNIYFDELEVFQCVFRSDLPHDEIIWLHRQSRRLSGFNFLKGQMGYFELERIGKEIAKTIPYNENI